MTSRRLATAFVPIVLLASPAAAQGGPPPHVRAAIQSVERMLESEGDAVRGLARGSTGTFDAILLDVMLPGGSGFDVCRTLRQRGIQTPILMLTARGQVVDRVVGLKLGADDYLVKPFAFDELCARIQALVRRRHQAKNPVIHLGLLEIDAARRQVSRAGAALHLTPSESISTGLMLFDFILDQPASAGVTSDDVAMELDWYMDWSLNDNFTLSFIAAIAEPGDAVEQSSGRSDTFIYGMIFAAYSN